MPIMSLSSDYQRDWQAYFDSARGLGPRVTLVQALAMLGTAVPIEAQAVPTNQGGRRRAIDVACGEGRDTRYLVANGFQVFAFDSSELGLNLLRESLGGSMHEQVHAVQLSFERVAAGGVLPSGVEVVNASFALPFCPPSCFNAVWNELYGALACGGWFAGQLFGERDDWAVVRPQSHYSRAETLALLQSVGAGYEVISFEEVEKDGSDGMGGSKHHHVFHVVARKR